MEDSYAAVLDKLGVPELIRLDVDRETGLRDSLIKSVFYSNVNNGHEVRNEDLLYRGKFEGKDGLLSDYMEIMNLDRVFGMMRTMNGHITPEDVEAARRTLLTGVYSQGKYLEGLRRYQLSVGPYLSVPSEEVREAFRGSIDRLNVHYDSPSMALLNVSGFYAHFTKLHPFEDGDGRTGRMISNYYLIGNGVKPIHVSDHIRDYWPKTSHPYYFGQCTIPEVVSTLLRIVDNGDKIQELADRALALDKRDPYELSVRDHILIQTGSIEAGRISRSDIKKDAEALYKMRGKSEELAVSALWLCTFAAVDSKILRAAYSDSNVGVRANALYAMAEIDFAKYKREIVKAAFEDPNSVVRMSAVGQLGYRREALDMDLASRLLDNETNGERSQSVMTAIAKFVSPRGKTSEEVEGFAKKLIDSGIDDLRIRGYLLVMKHCDEDTVIRTVREAAREVSPGVYAEADHIRKGMVIELKRERKLNKDKIAELFAELAVKDKVIRESLLGDLIVTKDMGEVNTKYDKLFDTIMKGEYPLFDKVYSMYMLGRRMGYNDLMLRYGLEEEGMSTFEKLAVNLIKFNDIVQGRMDCRELFKMLDEKDHQLLAVNLVEMGKLIQARSVPALMDGLAESLAKHIDGMNNPLLGMARHRSLDHIVDIDRLFHNVSRGLMDLSRETVVEGPLKAAARGARHHRNVIKSG